MDIWATMALPNTIDEATAARRNLIMEEENEYVEHLQQMQVDFQNKVRLLSLLPFVSQQGALPAHYTNRKDGVEYCWGTSVLISAPSL